MTSSMMRSLIDFSTDILRQLSNLADKIERQIPRSRKSKMYRFDFSSTLVLRMYNAMHYASATLVKLETKAMLPNVGYLLVHVLRVKFQTILVTEIAYGKSLKLG